MKPKKFLINWLIVNYLLANFSLSLFAQKSTKIDSSLALLKSAKADTAIINIYNKLSEDMVSSNADTALFYAKLALGLSKKHKYDRGLADAFYNLGIIEHYKNFNLDSAKYFYTKAFKTFTKTGHCKRATDALEELSFLMLRQGNYDESQDYALRCLTIGKSCDYPEKLNGCYTVMGHIHKYTGAYLQASKYYDSALYISHKINDQIGIAASFDNLGILYCLQGNYSQALEYHLKGLRIAEMQADSLSLGQYYGNIGVVYYYMKDMDNALKYFEKGKVINEKMDNLISLSFSLNNIGKVYEEKKDYQSAFRYYKESLEIKEKLNNKRSIAYSYYNMGLSSFYNKEYDKAFEYLYKSLKIREGIKDKNTIIWSYLSLGIVHFEMNNYEKAEEYLLIANKGGKEIGESQVIKETAETLSKLYAKQNNFKKAYEYLNLFKEMSDSLLNKQSIKEVTRLEMQFEFDKEKEKQAYEQEKERLAYEAQLKQQKLLRNGFLAGFVLVVIIGLVVYRSYIMKKKANAEKEVLLKEIHHRVKNNLQIISSLLSLQTKHLTDNVIKDAVKESQGRVKSMSLIHQMLYQQDKLAKIDFKTYVEQLITIIANSFSKHSDSIEKNIQVKNIQMDINTAIPLGLIINELVTNAYKHAFTPEEKGILKLELLKSEEGRYLLNIADNGIGLPDDYEIKHSDSLGLKLVHMLAKQLKGELTMDVNKGTSFRLEFNEIVKSA